jgi:hypothetical protein
LRTHRSESKSGDACRARHSLCRTRCALLPCTRNAPAAGASCGRVCTAWRWNGARLCEDGAPHRNEVELVPWHQLGQTESHQHARRCPPCKLSCYLARPRPAAVPPLESTFKTDAAGLRHTMAAVERLRPDLVTPVGCERGSFGVGSFHRSYCNCAGCGWTGVLVGGQHKNGHACPQHEERG